MSSADGVSAAPDVPAARPRLLVVDDQPVNIHVLYQTFCADYQVFMATSGPQGLALAREKKPDLVLLDVVMPDLDGFEVCRQLKADLATRDIPVIFVTSHNDAAAETRGLDVGAVDFISKPINPPVVRARVRTHLTLKHQSDLLRAMVFIDSLTGVHNRRYLDERLDLELRRATRSGHALALAMIDIDHFKRFNDRYGHPAGDDTLRRIAAALRACLKRPADLLARYGGEEFACILPDMRLDAARDFAQAMVDSVHALGIPHEASPVDRVVTISLGMAVHDGQAGISAAELLLQADSLLYRAKSEGRGRAYVARGSDQAIAPP